MEVLLNFLDIRNIEEWKEARSGLEKRKRIITEKRISDILFEAEISDFELPAVYSNVMISTGPSYPSTL